MFGLCHKLNLRSAIFAGLVLVCVISKATLDKTLPFIVDVAFKKTNCVVVFAANNI